MGDKYVEYLWVRIRGITIKIDLMTHICYRPPNQEKEMDDTFFRQFKSVSDLQNQVLTESFNYSNVFWESSRVVHNQFKGLCYENTYCCLMVVLNH